MTNASVLPELRELATRMQPEAEALSRGLTDHLVEQIPDLQTGGDELIEETYASTYSNIDQIFRLLKAGVPAESLTVPIEAAEWVRGLVLRGMGVPTLLRAYRLGHGWLWEHVSKDLHDFELRDELSAFLFTYIDHISGVLVDAYGSEQERVIRSAEQLRAETVRAILTGQPVDEETASLRLAYALNRHHVALRISSATTEVRGLDRAVQALGLTDPLVVPSAMATYDVWVASAEPLEDLEPPEGVRVAVGRPARGMAGFRTSHAEAREAARVAALAGDAARSVTTYAQIEVVSLMCSDLERARAFVRTTLGDLATPDDQTARLRETALAFIRAGGGTSQVAKELFVHANTVTYRIKRAEELLGRRVMDDMIGLGTALTLADALGPAVLNP